MIIVAAAISVSCSPRKSRRDREGEKSSPTDRLSSIKTINLMNLKRIKEEMPAERRAAGQKQRRDETVCTRAEHLDFN